jgi:hypothetical protein
MADFCRFFTVAGVARNFTQRRNAWRELNQFVLFNFKNKFMFEIL